MRRMGMLTWVILCLCLMALPARVQAEPTWCSTHFPNAIFCDDFDRYCNGVPPWPEACPTGADKSWPMIRAVWVRDDVTCGEMNLDETYFESSPFGSKYPCQGDMKLGQQTVDASLGIQRLFSSYASGVVGTDSDPLVLDFVLNGMTAMKVLRANGYLELTTETDRAPTNFVRHQPCDTFCPGGGPANDYTMVCQQESPPPGCPPIATAPHHASIAIGCMAFLDTDPCHCGSPTNDQVPMNPHPAYFDGYKWYSLRNGLFPGEGWFYLQDQDNIFRLTIMSTTVRIEMWTNQGHSWCEAPRSYQGKFNTIRAGYSKSCEIGSSSWTQCLGNFRCWLGVPGAGGVVFDNVAFYGGRGYGTLSITQHPTAKTICTGQSATFTVTAAGALPLEYQWQKNGADLTDGGHYSGVTTPTLTIANADANDAGSYRCVVTNVPNTVTSNAATLTLQTPRTISFTLAGGRWHLLSLPCDPVDPDPESVFPPGLPLDDKLWRYEPTLLSYVGYNSLDPPEVFGPMRAGVGYWLHVDDQTNVSYSGCCLASLQRVSMPLAGWSLLGGHQPGDVALANCSISNSTGATVPLSEAWRTYGWTVMPSYYYDHTRLGYLTSGLDSWDDDSYLRQYQGYWFQTLVPDLSLVVPYP